jgi:hypothetical protein
LGYNIRFLKFLLTISYKLLHILTGTSIHVHFFNFQRPHFAKHESGDQSAPIQNERAYYEQVMNIVVQAIRVNPRSPELHIKQLQLMEQRGDSKKLLEQEWNRVSDSRGNIRA